MRLLTILSSALRPSVRNHPVVAVGGNAIPQVGVPTAVVVWAELVMMSLRAWTSQSVAMWLELKGYRLESVNYCKLTKTGNEHEFVVYEFADEHKNKLVLRTDGAIVEPRDTSAPPSMGIVKSCGTDVSGHASFQRPRSSVSPLSLSSVSGMPQYSSHELPHPFDVDSNVHLAVDTVVRIRGHPAQSQVLKTITFDGDRSSRPSLWDVMILILVVHKYNTTHALVGRQGGWFANNIFGSLEKWASLYKNGTVVPGKAMRGRYRLLTGSHLGVTVHCYNAEHIDTIWENFGREREDKTRQKTEFERARKEDIEARKRLTEQLRELELEQVKAKKEQEERERLLREEQEERQRRYQEEQRLLQQQNEELRLELQRKDRELRMHQQWNDAGSLLLTGAAYDENARGTTPPPTYPSYESTAGSDTVGTFRPIMSG